MMAKRILLCGATGFLGRHTCVAMQSAGWTVLGLGRQDNAASLDSYRPVDLEDPRAVSRIVADFHPTDIVFMAGPANVPQSFADPEGDLRRNVVPLGSVLGAIRNGASSARLLIVSSAAVYGEPLQLPVGEDSALRPRSPYGFHKVIQETMIREYAEMFRIRTCVARVFSVFGPHQRKLAIWEMASRALNGDLSVRGDGSESRDYLFVEDAARAFLTLLDEAPFEGETVNVASGRAHALREVAAWLFRDLGISDPPRFDGVAVPGAPLHWLADVSKLKAFGFEERIGFREGLRRTAQWIRANA